MSVHYPPVFINEYLKEKVSEYFRDNPFDGLEGDLVVPFFPTSPTELEAVISSFPQSNGMFAVYDRMFKMRRKPFPHIKSEQLLYYFYKISSSPVGLLLLTQKVQDLLDFEDESAQDLNAWIRAKQESNNPIRDDLGNPMPRVFFHRIKVYQLEETRDIVDFGTARTYAGNKIIIDYDWHKS